MERRKLLLARVVLAITANFVLSAGSGPAAVGNEQRGTILSRRMRLDESVELTLRVPSAGGGKRLAQPISRARNQLQEEACLQCFDPVDGGNKATRKDEIELTLVCKNETVQPRCSSWCSDKRSFLGVGNAICLGQNPSTTLAVVALIVVLSIGLELGMHHLRHATHCPMLRKIMNQVFTEVMILGWISFCIFVGGKVGITAWAAKNDSTLGPSELKHFQEFWHYAIFITLMLYILCVLFLVVFANAVPKLWRGRESVQRRLSLGALSESQSARSNVIADYVAFQKTLNSKHWLLRKFNIVLMIRLYRSVNNAAYNLARQTSRPVYTDRVLLEYMFGVKRSAPGKITHLRYMSLAIRSVLAQVVEIRPITWCFFLGVGLLQALRIKIGGDTNLRAGGDMGSTLFIVLGGMLCVISFALYLHTFRVLQGIVWDRVQEKARTAASKKKKWGLLKLVGKVAGSARRLLDSTTALTAAPTAQTTAVPTRPAGAGSQRPRGTGTGGELSQYHTNQTMLRLKQFQQRRQKFKDEFRKHFWCSSPKMLLNLLQITFFIQALYITFLLLMFHAYGANLWGGFGLFLMILWPVLITCVIFPLTLPVLVLVLELVGHIGFERLTEIHESQKQAALHEKESSLGSSSFHEPRRHRAESNNPLFSPTNDGSTGHSADGAAIVQSQQAHL